MPQWWCNGVITSICKSGTKSDRSNYRGICIFICPGKLFAQFSIKDFSSTFSHVTYFIESQKGFLANNRTADHVLTLRALIDKYLNCHKTKVYTCFVDFRKAFDLLWHDGLFSLRSGRFEVVGTRKKRARERETREGKDSPHVSPARARSLFRPLLPSACYAGLGLY